MAAKKTFTDDLNPAETFISKPAIKKEPEAVGMPEAPAGFRILPEQKTKRLALLVRPTVYAKLKATADRQGLSVNELANRLFDEHCTN